VPNVKVYTAFDQGEDRVILANANMLAGPYLGPILADYDVPGYDQLAAVTLDAQTL
jgi:hypothetical protein